MVLGTRDLVLLGTQAVIVGSLSSMVTILLEHFYQSYEPPTFLHA